MESLRVYFSQGSFERAREMDGDKGTVYFVSLKHQQYSKHPTVLNITHGCGDYYKTGLFNILVFSEIPT